MQVNNQLSNNLLLQDNNLIKPIIIKEKLSLDKVNNNKTSNNENLEIKIKDSNTVKNFSFTNKQTPDEIENAFEKIENAETQEEKFDLIFETLKQNDAKIDEKPEHRNIVSFRNPNLPTENNKKGVYDDVTYVFWKDKEGNKRVESFQSNTDPNGLFIKSRPNGDFGRIVAGQTYTFSFSKSNDLGDVLRPTNKLNIERFDSETNKFKKVKTNFATDGTFLFHNGLDIYKNSPKMNNNTFSMGCQTFPSIYDSKSKTWDNQWKKFWETMNGNDTKNRQKEINYTILQLPDLNE
ncbi:MAG: hypothetical protein U0457_15560 [Candidatus Sericytochromatia bacterium]